MNVYKSLLIAVAAVGLFSVDSSTTYAQPPQAKYFNPNPGPSQHFDWFLGVNLTQDYRGMRIRYVKPGSPAAKAGLERNDIIYAINNRQIRNEYDFDQALHNCNGYMYLRVINWRNSQPVGVSTNLDFIGPVYYKSKSNE
ncbi:Hypothetical protein PBC10988_22920 [Planctomycetales bacterium 10988]|nr:Hypothetical protein PBC10988_22920 [Planctomycetales bacterium 10988]